MIFSKIQLVALLAVVGPFLPTGHASTLRGHEEEGKVTKVRPVKVKILEEALCPGCKQFVTETLTPVYHKLGATVIDLQVVPFGNARYLPSKEDPDKLVLECQHGEAECDANSFEQCVSLMLYPYPQRYLPFLDCLYDKLPIGHSEKKIDRSIFAGCAKDAALDWKSIAECHDNDNTARALQQVASALTPDHQYVPWVEINGQHLELKENDDFIKAICQAYQEAGGSNPACDEVENLKVSAGNVQELARCANTNADQTVE